VLVLAAASFAAGAVLASGSGAAERATARAYVLDWERGHLAAMYRLLDPRSRRDVSEAQFTRRLGAVAATATLRGVRLIRVASPQGDAVPVRVLADTRVWGSLRETLLVPVTSVGSAEEVRLAPELLFPGLRGTEVLHRHTTLPPRATLLASDGTPLAQGPGRTSPIPTVAGEIVGTLGPVPAADAEQATAEGVPRGARVGLDGLERVFQARLAGRVGGVLLAGGRVLARARAREGAPVRTTIVPALEQAAINALAGQYAGLAVMNPRTGAVLALAGIAFSAPQPPGSTMKIVTATAILQAGLATPDTTFPVQTAATIDGYTLQNADGEACGGTLLNAFAVSCNSVFAPLGARLGAARLVATARRFGFDQPTGIPGAAESSIPDPAQIGDSLAVGSSAIGQGKVLSTPLEMTDAAATIAMGGRRPIPTLLAGARPRFVAVTTPQVAREVQRMMEAVVSFGTGTAAQIPGVTVAGKTGTAELVDTAPPVAPGQAEPNAASSPKNTDAWFVGYAPAGHPLVAAGAMFPNQGAGGATAAPAVRDLLVAALGR
jgi:peptidoglycan glycosyltransferase